ncbi:chemokine (C-X-C motif) ligand 18b [Morone saxatilis]|uniref:chemokine (C-X-C motif) ligand 18b n=1 Tax=Morone saxatilis TaxID=34816 RepID=UPI0015E1CFA1|nr:chemokine (C-X-C motif) ligand 18b [Morone saxatilis]
MDSGKTHSALAIKGKEPRSSSSLLSSQPARALTFSSKGSLDFFFVSQRKKMALSQKSCALLLAVVAAVCIQLHQAHDFPGRCRCHTTVKFIRGNISDFHVYKRRPGCDKTELFVTLDKANNSTEDICMNTEGKMAKAFLRCWERINKEESRKIECIDRKRKAE